MWGLVLLSRWRGAVRQGWEALGRSAAPQAVVVEDRVDDAREARLVLDAPRRRAVPEVDEIAAHEADLAGEVVVPDVVLGGERTASLGVPLSLIHISEPTRLGMISYAVFCLKKKKNAKR